MKFLPELELIDRLCIARVKYERTTGGNQDELDWYEDRYQELVQGLTADQLKQLMTISKKLQKYTIRFGILNGSSNRA